MLTFKLSMTEFANALGIVNKNIQLLEQAQSTWSQVKLPHAGDQYASFKNIVDLYA